MNEVLDHAGARALKAELAGYVHELLEGRIQASTAAPPVGVALGLAPQPGGGFQVALRYRLGVPTARMVARKVAQQVGPGVDVRRTGRITAVPGVPGIAPRPPVITAQAAGETGRVRPLRPGVSIAHKDVTAGTLGAFVLVDEVVHALSNYHVLVGSPSAKVGDHVLQPGPYDGGLDPQDQVGTLAAFGPLERDGTFVVDGAVALLADQQVEATYPAGAITSTAVPAASWLVEKIGRTTGVTRGRVTAIELDGVVVGYGAELGELTFDDQIEVQGVGADPFSRGGDSGSLVYRVGADGAEGDEHPAIGLLFAGSESGGENGKGLTYLNPIERVLETFGARLVGS